jgi:hypothetical protein
LPGEKLAKYSFFSTGGFVMGGRNSRICGKEIDEASQERQMPHQGTWGLLFTTVQPHHARAGLAGAIMRMMDRCGGKAAVRFGLQLDLAGSITPNRSGLQEARKA